MEELIKKQEEIIKEKIQVTRELNQLKDNEFVIKYLELLSKNKDLDNQNNDLIKQLKKREYEVCSHIWIETAVAYENNPDTGLPGCDRYCGCIKCGLNLYAIFNKESATLEEQAMIESIEEQYYCISSDRCVRKCDFNLAKMIYSKLKAVCPDIDDLTVVKYFNIVLDYIPKNHKNPEKYFRKDGSIIMLLVFNEDCDFNLATAIYLKIKENYPNIDDLTLKSYFEHALSDIQNTPVSDERKISRARRLALNSDFNNWNGRKS